MLENLNPFRWGSAESKPASSPDNITGDGKTESNIDISVPMFHFTKEEKGIMKEKGASDEEIDMKEKDVVRKLARGQNH